MAASTLLKLPLLSSLVGFAALALGGCASAPTLPAGVPVHPLVAEMLTLRGTAAATLANPACSAANPSKPAHLMELSEDTRATVMLGPQLGEPPLPVSMLHLTHLESNRTWCVMTREDGTPASLADELPMGTYAVSVLEMRGEAPRRYELKVRKL
jgi:hypothetical protein